MTSKLFFGTLAALSVASLATAQIVPTPGCVITTNIATSQVWGPAGTPGAVGGGGVYQLRGEIHVLDGATLTILPGTVIASDASLVVSGPASLSIDRGAMLIANGTRKLPIVFTSVNDGTTPAGALSSNLNGAYRPAATAEWGGLTLHGEGYVSYCGGAGGTTVGTPTSTNEAPMEGLVTAGLRNYGGGKVASTMPSGYLSDGDGDNDDSGSLRYVSLRYNGFVAGSTVELNGLSLGGCGRETDVNYFETVNSQDDGVEIWGGTVNVKNVVVWACGDDSFDVDQGWRGQAQHGLIVQGATTGTSQGSGISDNCFEMDGAERCDWQPITSSIIANFTVVGMYDPIGTGTAAGNNGGDHGAAYRDNARVQFHRCMWVDIGDRLVNNDNSDGERCNNPAAPGGVACGYGFFGTLSWPATWTTSSATLSTVNPFPGGAESTPAEAYTAQVAGNLIEWRDNLVYNANASLAFLVEANNRSVFTGGGGTNNANNVNTATSPLAPISRAAAMTMGGVDFARVTFLDPRPITGEGQLSTEWAPEGTGVLDGVLDRGGFGEGNLWTTDWTAVANYGLIPSDPANVDLGGCRPGSQGCPQLITTGTWAGGTNVTFTVKNLDPILSTCLLVVGGFRIDFPIFGGTLIPSPDILLTLTGAPGSGTASFSFINPPGFSGNTLYSQAAGIDFTQFGGLFLEQFSYSNGNEHLQP